MPRPRLAIAPHLDHDEIGRRYRACRDGVERTFAWLGRYRRNSRDYEWSTESSEAMLKVCSIHRMLRLLSPDESKKPVAFKYREL